MTTPQQPDKEPDYYANCSKCGSSPFIDTTNRHAHCCNLMCVYSRDWRTRHRWNVLNKSQPVSENKGEDPFEQFLLFINPSFLREAEIKNELRRLFVTREEHERVTRRAYEEGYWTRKPSLGFSTLADHIAKGKLYECWKNSQVKKEMEG